MRLQRLTDENVSVIPHYPGVYFFFDEQAHVIYVGKALRLKARLNEHLESHNYLKYFRETGRRHLLPLLHLQIIDYALDRAKYFATLFASEDRIAEEEQKYITILGPCLNYATSSLEYQVIQSRMEAESRRPEDEEQLREVMDKLDR
jgi:predicted GIY-YIG superfamily endonuclease